jgi:enoyl-CoA hydratase/carnithine racemase
VSGDAVVLSERERMAYLTLNAPPRNEMNSAFFRALAGICRERLPQVRARGLVVHSAGRHFSSGADLDELRRLVAEGGSTGYMRDNTDAFLAIERLEFPVVAAITGCCLGAGLELALACRYRVAATNAVLGLPESTFGLIPGCGGTVRLPLLVGRAAAARMILTGRSVTADEALAAGLVDAVVDRREVVTAAEKLVRKLAGAAGGNPQTQIPKPKQGVKS